MHNTVFFQIKLIFLLPEPSSLDDLASSQVLARVAVAGVYLVLAVGAVVCGRAGALVATVGEAMTRGAVATRLRKAQVALGQYLHTTNDVIGN